MNRKPAQLADSPLPINKSRGRLYSLEEPIVTRLYTMKESRHAYKRKHRSTVLVKTWKLCEPLNNRTYHAERSLMSAGKEQLNLGRDIAFPLHRGSRSFSRSPFPPSSSPAFRKKGESGERERIAKRGDRNSTIKENEPASQRRGLIVPTERSWFPSKAIKSMRRINTHVLGQNRRCALPFHASRAYIFEESRRGSLWNFPKLRHARFFRAVCRARFSISSRQV